MRTRRNGCRIGGGLLTRFQVRDQLRQRRDGLAQHFENGGRPAKRVVENAVEQVLDRPSELTEIAGANHAAATLQCVE